jgi:hypothetical protein
MLKSASMLIRDAQLRIFDRESHREYLRRVLDLVERLAPGCLPHEPEQELEEQAEQAFRRAREFGCQTEYGIGLFIAATFIGGSGFENDPECAAIMSDRTTPPDARVSQLFSDLADTRWDVVRGRCLGKAG